MFNSEVEASEDYPDWGEIGCDNKPLEEIIENHDHNEYKLKVCCDGSMEMHCGITPVLMIPSFQANVSPDGLVVVNIRTENITPALFGLVGEEDFTLSPDDAETLGNLLIAASKEGCARACATWDKMQEEEKAKEAVS